MLAEQIEPFAQPGTSFMAPRAVADALDMNMSDLADLIGVSRSALYDSTEGDKVQRALSKLVQIVIAATDLAGSRGRAVLWFKHQPLPGYRLKTPMDLFKAGDVEAVRITLENVRSGVYA